MATAIIYWSGSGNTEAMANAIATGMRAQGADAAVFSVDQADAAMADRYDKFAFGCPASGVEVLEEGEFDPFFEEIEGRLAGKKVALFGAYGWGDGAWMRDWQKRVEKAGADLFEAGLIQQDPDDAACAEFGARFAQY